MLTWLPIALVSLGQNPLPKLPAAQSNDLREAYAAALAEPDGPGRSRFLSLAKELEARHELASLVEALRKGPKLPAGEPKPRRVGGSKEKFVQVERTMLGFCFEFEGDVFRYAVDVPSGYDPARPRALLLDPGHGSGQDDTLEEKAKHLPYFRRNADAGDLRGCLIARTEILEQIGADGIKGGRPDDQVAAVFGRFFQDLASRFAIDPERVYVAGISQTGYWSWYLGRARADRFAGIAPLSAVTWQVDAYLGNLEHLATFVGHAAGDEVCPVEQPRRTTAEMKRRGFRVVYEEVEGGHGAAFPMLGAALQWFAPQVRTRTPKSISHALQTLHTPWCHWVRVTALEKPGDGRAKTPPRAQVSAAVEGQNVQLSSAGVRALELMLSSDLLDLEQPVFVTWNGRIVHRGPVKRGFARAAELALASADWARACEAVLELEAPR